MNTPNNEVVTITNAKAEKCYTNIRNAENKGKKATWEIANAMTTLVVGGIKTEEIAERTSYSKSTVSKLSNTFKYVVAHERNEEIVEKYSATTVSEIASLSIENKDTMIEAMLGAERPLTVKEIRILIKELKGIEDKGTTEEVEEVDVEELAPDKEKFDKKAFIEYLITSYSISDIDAEILRNKF